jgi:hypothetical protein
LAAGLEIIYRKSLQTLLSSMVSLTMLNTINRPCNRIQTVGQNSTVILGALPDFHQLGPTERASLGQLIRHRFTDVITLDEQMRQANDPEFRGLLRQAREGTITTADVDALSAKMLQCLPRYKGLDIV